MVFYFNATNLKGVTNCNESHDFAAQMVINSH